MNFDPSGCFAISFLLIGLIVGAAAGGTLGGITAASNGQDILTGILTGALLGAAVGGIIAVGGAALSGAVSSTLSKVVTDIVDVALYGGSFGNWEDYAISFAFGGLAGSLGNAVLKGNKITKGIKYASDVVLRPAVNQLVKMGTRGNEFEFQKYFYDVGTRALTYNGTHTVMKGNIFGMNLKVDLGKSFYRGSFRGIYNYL